MTVSNGTVYGLTVMEGASVTVNGGSNHAGEWVVGSGATLNITDGTFGDVQFTRNGTIAISGGTFKSIKSDIAEELQPLMSLLDTQKVHAFYKGDDVQDGNATELADVTVKEHTHTMVNNKCACGFSCTHTNTEGASTIDKDGKCTVCGTQFAAAIGEIYYTDVKSALDAAADGQTVRLLANGTLPPDIYASKTLTLDLDGHSLSGYSLNVGGLTAMSQVRTGKLTVIDSSGGNGAVGVTVRDGGTLVFDPKNDHITLLQLEVWGGTVELYGGKILRSGLQLHNNITLGDLLPGQAGLAYYRGDTQLTLEEATSQTCDLVVKLCSHGGKNGFDGTNCPYCNAPAVAETALNNGERRFANLQTALDADRDGGATLQLLADVTGDYTINGTQDTGLNLNGYSIKGTVTVKAAAGSNTTTLSNTKNTTTVSIDQVVAHKGAKLGGSKYPAVIGELTLADTTKWKDILQEPTRLGFKVTSADGTYKWYAPNDVKGSQLSNVIINSLPITTKTLNLKVDGKSLTGNSPKVERGTTVQLCASCNKDAEVYIYTGEIVGNNVPTYSQKKAEYQKIGTSWYYVVDLPCNTIGKYSVYFTATKDGYTVQSAEKKLTVTKPNLSHAEITFPYGNEAAFNSVSATGVPMFVVTYNGTKLEENVDFVITRGASTYDVGPCTLTIKATDNGDYTGSKSAEWTVRPLKVAASVGDIIKTYDGTTNLPENTKITFNSADSYYTGTTLRLAKGTDYEVSNAHYDSADASQEEKTISFTIRLKNEGYVFEDGTTQKDFTLNGAELNDKSFKINKAAAPTNIPTGTLNVINGTQQTYTYDFSQLLPELSEGEYGTISYGNQATISLVNQSGYYYDETIVEFKNGVLILAQFYAKDGNMTGKIGTVKVKVTTTNYEDFQLTLVLNAVNQIKPTPDGKITASKITYGDTLSKSEISGKMKDPTTGAEIEGTFAWQNPDTVLNASTTGRDAEWKFTPTDKAVYTETTGTAFVKVDKAMQSGTVSMAGYTYGKTPGTPRIENRTGDLSALVTYYYARVGDGNAQVWDIDNPPVLNAGTYWMNARIGQTDNYNGYDTNILKFEVARATPKHTVPSGLTAKYGQTLADVTLPDGWSWMDSSESVGGASTDAKKFKAKFTPTDIANYNVAENIELEVTVNKADQAALTIQGADSVFYGQTLTLTASGGSGTGAVTYRVDTAYSTGKATIDPNTGVLTPVKVGSVSVVATKAGDNDYNDVTSALFVLMVKPATPTGAPKYTEITTSGKTLKDAALTTKGSTLNPSNGKLEWVDDKGEPLPDDTTVKANTTYKWRFTPDDDNYTTLTGEVELYHRSSGGGGSYIPSYTVSADKTENGTITVSPKSASKGDTVTITVKPDKGYELDTLKVLDQNGDKVKLTEKDGKYTFKMPDSKVEIQATFVKETEISPFGDVSTDAYYYEAVKWAQKKGITGGIGNDLFGPNQPCTRAQIATFLWRAAGSPEPKNMSSFSDVPTDSYYAKAVAWAVENGITAGTGDGKFSPNAPCTRAQSVTFLYRASGSPAVSDSAVFADVEANAFYADAVAWAVANGVTNGTTSSTFSPDNGCTRAQIVTFLYRAFNK